MNNEIIGKFIANLRKEKKLTQKDLADKLGITDRAVSKWERGICMPDISLLSDLSVILNISIAELLNGSKATKTENSSDENIKITINYANKQRKENLRRVINNVMLSFAIFISLLVVLLNIRNKYYFKKKYSYSVFNVVVEGKNSYNNLSDYIEHIEKHIELINKNKGKFTTSEYKNILNTVNEIKEIARFDRDIEMTSRYYFTYSDMYELIYSQVYEYSNDIKYSLKYKNTYDIILKYDKSKSQNLSTYNDYNNQYNDYYSYVKNFVDSFYSYNSSLNNDEIGFETYYLIQNQYSSYDTLLNDIIEVGGIHE